MTVRAAWLLSGGAEPGQSREDTRLAPLGTFAPEGELTTRAGVIAGGNPFAASGVGAMSLQVGVGRALVQGTTAQGAYPIAVTSPETLAFGDGNAQFARIDSVILHVYDGLYDTSGQTLAAVEILPGEATATPAPPTLPAGCLRLWDVAVPAGVSAGTGGIDWASALTDRRRYTAAYGGIVPQGSASDVGAYDGQYRDNGGVLERWSAAEGEWLTYRTPDPVLVEITTGATAGTGFSVTAFRGRRRAGGACTVSLQVERTGAKVTSGTSENAGNIIDLPMATLPAGWRPPFDMGVDASDGFADGEARLTTDGVMTLRTWTPNGTIESGRTILMTTTWML